MKSLLFCYDAALGDIASSFKKTNSVPWGRGSELFTSYISYTTAAVICTPDVVYLVPLKLLLIVVRCCMYSLLQVYQKRTTKQMLYTGSIYLKQQGERHSPHRMIIGVHGLLEAGEAGHIRIHRHSFRCQQRGLPRESLELQNALTHPPKVLLNSARLGLR